MPQKKHKHAEIDTIIGDELATLVHDFKKERQLIGDIESLMSDAEKLIASKKNLMLEEMAFEKKLVQQKLNAMEKERKSMLKEIESQRDEMMKEVEKQRVAVQADQDALDAEKEAMKTRDTSGEDILSLNVGGAPFQALRRTLCKVELSMLASQFSGR